MSGTLLIRADAGSRIGVGHVMRCTALGEAWLARGGEVVFASSSVPVELFARLGAEGFATRPVGGSPGAEQDARETAALARSCSADCIVLDGYHFDSAYRRLLRPAEARVLVIVDGASGDGDGADFVLDQNLGAARPGRERQDSTATRFLLGPRYALLRREFWRWRGRAHAIAPRARKLLVTLGGGDADNCTGRIVRALRAVPEAAELETRVVIGPANPHRAVVEAELKDAPSGWRALPPQEDMSDPFAWADLAVSAAGSTCWELAFMGVPFLTVALADNQRPIAAELARAGVSRDLGWHEQVGGQRLAESVRELLDDDAARGEMSRRGRETVDGFGAERVAAILSEVAA